MESTTWIILIVSALIFLFIFWAISTYNRLVKARNYRREAWSGITVFLKKRYDLVPNLLEIVRGYAAFEKGVVEQVSVNRSMAMKASAPGEKLPAEQRFSQALGSFFAVAESYPDLKASENFRQLQDDLARLETEIESARRYYNASVRENNILVESFPASVIAGMGKFEKGDYFELENNDHLQVPQVSFNATR
ncbi:LemA family protein [Filimonas effusa]|uniref:LemA family protein n=1 Tax=Filimonas effusa TaxID=2508721 RepID=A0A4Q1D5N8_9BACT|nr:LemA family protein [Filimonas effusa]RXK82971.1 LemA family protein [Filimonas effusa]